MAVWWENSQFRGGVAVFGVVAVGIAALLAALSIATGVVPWAVVVFVPLGLTLVMFAGFVLALQPWSYASDIKAMLAGDAWVHWTYDESDWRAANRLDQRTYERWIRGLLVALAVGVVLLVAGIAGGRSAISASAFGGSLTFLALVMLAALVAGSPVRAARRAERGEVYVSRLGVYRRPGGYVPHDRRRRVDYEKLELVDRPTPHIHIVVRYLANGKSYRKTTDIGVPRGHEDEARELVARIRREVVNARNPRQSRLDY